MPPFRSVCAGRAPRLGADVDLGIVARPRTGMLRGLARLAVRARSAWRCPAPGPSARSPVAISMRRGFSASGTSRTRSTVSRPFSRFAPVTFTWSARLKVCLKARVAIPRCRNCFSSGSGCFLAEDQERVLVLGQLDLVGREARHRHRDAVLVVARLLDVVGRPVGHRLDTGASGRACRTAGRSRPWTGTGEKNRRFS